MPKFTYSAAKGIEQSNGSGFIIQDVPISRSIMNSGAAFSTDGGSTTDTEEVMLIDLTAKVESFAIPDGTAVGEQKIIITANGNGGRACSVGTNGSEASLGSPAAGAIFMLVWNGSLWKKLT